MEYLSFCNENNLIGMFFEKILNKYKIESEYAGSYGLESLRDKFLLTWIITLIKLNSNKLG